MCSLYLKIRNTSDIFYLFIPFSMRLDHIEFAVLLFSILWIRFGHSHCSIWKRREALLNSVLKFVPVQEHEMQHIPLTGPGLALDNGFISFVSSTRPWGPTSFNEELFDSPLEQFPAQIMEFARWKKLSSLIQLFPILWRFEGVNKEQISLRGVPTGVTLLTSGVDLAQNQLEVIFSYIFHWDNSIYKHQKSKKMGSRSQNMKGQLDFTILALESN